MPVAGYQAISAKDTPLTSVNYGLKGANQLYDFSTLTATKKDTLVYSNLTGAQQTNFPNATICATADHGGSYIYAKNTSSVFDIEGLSGTIGGNASRANFSPVEDLYHFPVQYNGSYSGNWGFQSSLPGSAVGFPLFNAVRVTYTNSYTDTIDGWGKVITPVGAYKGLRAKRVNHTETVTEYQVFSGGSWTQYSDVITDNIEYSYLSKESKGALVSFDYDSIGRVKAVNYSLVPPAAPVAYFTYNGHIGAYSFLDSTDGYPTTYHWDFGDGDTIDAVNPWHTFTSNGTYNVCLTVTNAGGSSTYCQSIIVSGIVVTDVTSLNDETSKLYPNPANNILNVQLSSAGTIEINNLLGEVMITQKVKDGENHIEIPVNQLSNGIYIATLTKPDGSKTSLGRFAKAY